VATESADSIGGPQNWAQEHAAAYRAAWQEIKQLPPGGTILYHEGHLAVDAARHAEIAGRAAAFLEAATELAEGVLAQQRVRAEWYRYMFRKSRP
jgi:hypothetical protein